MASFGDLVAGWWDGGGRVRATRREVERKGGEVLERQEDEADVLLAESRASGVSVRYTQYADSMVAHDRAAPLVRVDFERVQKRERPDEAFQSRLVEEGDRPRRPFDLENLERGCSKAFDNLLAGRVVVLDETEAGEPEGLEEGEGREADRGRAGLSTKELVGELEMLEDRGRPEKLKDVGGGEVDGGEAERREARKGKDWEV